MAETHLTICSVCKGVFLYVYAPLSGMCPKCEATSPKPLTVYVPTPTYAVQGGTPPKMFMLPLKKTLPMKNGEIRKLPKANSPMWTDQWAVQGTAAKPYVVSHRTKDKNTIVEWTCSCPNWTQHTPRTECKHILLVIVKEKLVVPTGPASMDKETAKEFAAFQKARARKAAGVKEDWGISEGRKFR